MNSINSQKYSYTPDAKKEKAIESERFRNLKTF